VDWRTTILCSMANINNANSEATSAGAGTFVVGRLHASCGHTLAMEVYTKRNTKRINGKDGNTRKAGEMATLRTEANLFTLSC